MPLKKCQCSKPRVGLCLDLKVGGMNFCSMVLHCQKGGWQSAGKRVIEWMLLNEADEMMLILLHLFFAFFLLNPYSGSFWGPQSCFLPPNPPVGATCLILLINLFIYLFLAVSGLHFCARAFSSCGKRGPLLIAVHGPLTIAASLVAEHRLQTRRLSNCGSRA